MAWFGQVQPVINCTESGHSKGQLVRMTTENTHLSAFHRCDALDIAACHSNYCNAVGRCRPNWFSI